MGFHSFYASSVLASFLFVLVATASHNVSHHTYTHSPHHSTPPPVCHCVPPPPPPPCPPPPKCPPPPLPSTTPYLNKKLRIALGAIKDFKKEILKDPRNDPKNITANWNGPNPCSFKGFKCNKNPSYKNKFTVSGIQFNGFNISAPLEGLINHLDTLSICHCNSNHFHGPVPSKIGTSTLPFLFELDLSNNNFEGPFPTQVLQATNLTFLDLRFNNFAGTVPPQVFSLDVDVLFINNNNFLQALPSELGNTPVLYLTLANNNFTGPIPGTIGQASKTLLEVLFLNNQISGCLPWEIGQLKLARVFDVSRNYLHGPIPMSFACLENMQILNLGSNMLDGVVPEEVCELPRLRNLTLRNNFFTEVGPKCRELIAKKVLDVSFNCIRDLKHQKTPEECARFFAHKPVHRCPDPYQHLPCKAAGYFLGGSNRRRASEVEQPFLSAMYGALDPL